MKLWNVDDAKYTFQNLGIYIYAFNRLIDSISKLKDKVSKYFAFVTTKRGLFEWYSSALCPTSVVQHGSPSTEPPDAGVDASTEAFSLPFSLSNVCLENYLFARISREFSLFSEISYYWFRAARYSSPVEGEEGEVSLLFDSFRLLKCIGNEGK